MRQSLKIALSLLVSLVLFAGFAVLAYSGLFNVVQAGFFVPRLEAAWQSDVGALGARIDTFNRDKLEAFVAEAKKSYVAAAFATKLSDADSAAWAEFIARLGDGGVRLLGADGRKIYYSSYATDRRSAAAGQFTFANYTDDATVVPASEILLSAGDAPRVYIDGDHASFLYLVPVTSGTQSSTLVVAVPRQVLLADLGVSSPRPVNDLTLVGTRGILVNDPVLSAAAHAALASLWSGGSTAPATLNLKAGDGTASSWRVFTARLATGGVVSLMEKTSAFEMPDVMKVLLLATFFLTVFLLLFLSLNLRSDPLEVLRQRVKRFQVELITELVETPRGADWGRWRGEMEARKDEITWQIQRGIGRVSRKKKPVIDEYLSKSWDEILDLISRRVETPQVAAPVMDLSRIEARLESLIRAAQQNASAAPAPSRVAPPPRQLKVEEISAEDVTESAEPIEDAEGVEVAETVDEAEAVEEVEPTPVEEAAPVQDAEIVEEAEAVEEAEPVEVVEAAETVDEAEAVEEVEPTPVEEAAPVQDAEIVEEAEAVEEAEPVEVVEAAETVDQAEAVEAVTPVSALPTARVPTRTAEIVESIDASEVIDELEPVEPVPSAPMAASGQGSREPVEPSSSFQDAEVVVEDAGPGEADVEVVLEAERPVEDLPAVEVAVEEVAVEDVALAEDAVEIAEAVEEAELVEDEVADKAMEVATIRASEVFEADQEPVEAAAPRFAAPITEFMEIRIPHADSAREPDAPGRAAAPAAVEPLEELEPLADIVPLPPEPFEEGLELLPAAEETVSTRRAAKGDVMGGNGDRDEELEEELGDAPVRPGVPPAPSATAPAPEPSRVVAPAPAPAPAPAAETVEDVEDLEPASDEESPVEDLEPLPAEAGEADVEPAETVPGDLQGELDALVAAGVLRTWTLDDMRAAAEEAQSAVVLEDGVYRIKQDVYAAADAPKKSPAQKPQAGGLRELAEQVVSHGAEKTAGRGEDGAPGSIGDLLSDEDALDLSGVVSRDKEQVADESLSIDRERENPLLLKRQGVDYDAFLSSYPRAFTTTVQMKSLVELSRRVSAVSAALLVKKVSGYTPDLTVGIGEKTTSVLSFGSGEPFFETILLPRKGAFLDRNPSETMLFRSRFDKEDLRYARRLAILPALFRSQEAYLIFVFSSETLFTIESLISRLKIKSA